jgi:hypothetical protein
MRICCSLTDKTILLFETNLAGNDDEDFETKPAAQMKKPPRKVGSSSKPSYCACHSLFVAFTSQFNNFIGKCTGRR